MGTQPYRRTCIYCGGASKLLTSRFTVVQAGFDVEKHDRTGEALAQIFCWEGSLVKPEDCEEALAVCENDPMQAIDHLNLLRSKVCCTIMLYGSAIYRTGTILSERLQLRRTLLAAI
jgi:hypothetical protein